MHFCVLRAAKGYYYLLYKIFNDLIGFARFQTMSDAIIGRIDDMGNRIDELERSISELMTQTGDDKTLPAVFFQTTCSFRIDLYIIIIFIFFMFKIEKLVEQEFYFNELPYFLLNRLLVNRYLIIR